MNSKRDQLRKDSDCLLCPQRHEQALNPIPPRSCVKGLGSDVLQCGLVDYGGALLLFLRGCGLIYTHLWKTKSVLEKACAFPGSQTFGSGVHTPHQHCSPRWECVHGFLGTECWLLGSETGTKILTISNHENLSGSREAHLELHRKQWFVFTLGETG